ncbi:MAG TPA: ABC transporter ATP-binding protein, partial [Dongiaceae bacterium]|nr:ABC transporter ATP-binding protein [Dongiaceae bacterium]
IVMYHGKVMESGTLDDIFRHPSHPYLEALLRAVPRFHMKPNERLTPLREIPPPSGRLISAREPWPAGADAAGPLLQVEGLSKRFRVRGSSGASGTIVAVDDVSFEIKRGECLGLVGESGCGKTTLSKVIMRALSPDTGTIRFNDHGKSVNVLDLKGEELTKFRRHIQFIFQDPFGSLNPRMTVFDILSEPLLIHGIGTAAERAELVKELMALVGLNVQFLKRYPHSFSGGQRQRIGIARALALKPDLLLCDEPVSALDVSIQAQVLNLLKDLQAKLGLTFLFISHNLAVVDYIADRIMVMCGGRIVEVAPCGVLFKKPIHPYTKALLAAVPEPNPDYRLSFDKLMEGKTSKPSAWPAPFTINDAERPGLINPGEGHFVRAGTALVAA